MAFIGTPKDPEFFEQNRAPAGHVPNFVTTFAARPAVFDAWKQLNGAIKESMDLRRYELATLAAATALKSSYCSLAHGQVLADKYYTAEEVAALVTEPPNDPVDRAVMAFARKVALSADDITQADVDALKALGLSPEGGSTGARLTTRATESSLADDLHLTRGVGGKRAGFCSR